MTRPGGGAAGRRLSNAPFTLPVEVVSPQGRVHLTHLRHPGHTVFPLIDTAFHLYTLRSRDSGADTSEISCVGTVLIDHTPGRLLALEM